MDINKERENSLSVVHFMVFLRKRNKNRLPDEIFCIILKYRGFWYNLPAPFYNLQINKYDELRYIDENEEDPKLKRLIQFMINVDKNGSLKIDKKTKPCQHCTRILVSMYVIPFKKRLLNKIFSSVFAKNEKNKRRTFYFYRSPRNTIVTSFTSRSVKLVNDGINRDIEFLYIPEWRIQTLGVLFKKILNNKNTKGDFSFNLKCLGNFFERICFDCYYYNKILRDVIFE